MPSNGEGNGITPVLLPGKSHGRRSLVGCSPWSRWGSDTTEQHHVHFSLSCIGEGNGNPLQCSCLENPRDGGSWWPAVYGVAQSWTRLKWLSSIFWIRAWRRNIFSCLLTRNSRRTCKKQNTTYGGQMALDTQAKWQEAQISAKCIFSIWNHVLVL